MIYNTFFGRPVVDIKILKSMAFLAIYTGDFPGRQSKSSSGLSVSYENVFLIVGRTGLMWILTATLFVALIETVEIAIASFRDVDAEAIFTPPFRTREAFRFLFTPVQYALM